MPVEPPPTRWALPSREDLVAWADADDLIGVGGDLAPGTVLAAYRRGLFPMPGAVGDHRVGWWSPVERGVLELADLRVSRSLRRSLRGFEIRIDTAFEDVIDGCADPRRPGAWIDAAMRAAYVELHRLGWVHSVETWRDGRLVGGLYGVAVGGVFAGESMFHRETDASKAALVGLVEALRDEYADRRLIDVQWQTPHLASLGVTRVPRADYLARLRELLELPQPAAFG
ncbi:leucyl/phenylalanyl-tRNA--protein transferase [Nocardioides panacisoli]|uniref:leucyl/phenylalanyl-tRNA--protein transferase n=1 Tax=Nocardioides panacisoli TaxID=627624 RepID=UPI001C62A6A2|nr:leucyl/phenylalanyl-tRNA--protein transferase [Nocardioides panacisoli]QYJ03467.1 leucyl/phenylalanyl-tRNA--protein transferase [Nocardioides panacisoli]